MGKERINFNSVFYFDQIKVHFSSKAKKLPNLWFKSKKDENF